MQQTIATLFQLKRHLGIPPDDATHDDRLLTALRAAASHLERETHRGLSPRLATVRHVPLTAYADEIALRGDLLSLTGVTDADGPVPLDEITVEPGTGVGTLLRRTTGGFAWGTDGIQVTGVWGWHDHPSRMWLPSGDVVTGADLLAADTTLSVGDADALMSDNHPPRFTVGVLLRLDAEFLTVEAVDATTDTLTVARGVNGTVPADHLAGTGIEVYRPPYDVTMSVLSLAAWLYRQPDIPGDTTIPADVLGAVVRLRRLTVA
jgi:hypothetical protein